MSRWLEGGSVLDQVSDDTRVIELLGFYGRGSVELLHFVHPDQSLFLRLLRSLDCLLVIGVLFMGRFCGSENGYGSGQRELWRITACWSRILAAREIF